MILRTTACDVARSESPSPTKYFTTTTEPRVTYALDPSEKSKRHLSY